MLIVITLPTTLEPNRNPMKERSDDDIAASTANIGDYLYNFVKSNAVATLVSFVTLNPGTIEAL